MNVQKKMVKMCLGCEILENGAEKVISLVEKDTAAGIACRKGGWNLDEAGKGGGVPEMVSGR